MCGNCLLFSGLGVIDVGYVGFGTGTGGGGLWERGHCRINSKLAGNANAIINIQFTGNRDQYGTSRTRSAHDQEGGMHHHQQRPTL